MSHAAPKAIAYLRRLALFVRRFRCMAATPKKVLVVEDHADCRELLSTIITRLGYEVVEAASGLEAIFRALTAEPDLILMDLGLPAMSGVEATLYLKEQPSTREIPIVINTAWSDADHRERALTAGAAEILLKPLSLRILHDVLNRYLSAEDK